MPTDSKQPATESTTSFGRPRGFSMDQDSGFQCLVDGYVRGLLTIDQENEYVLLYRTDKFLGRYV
jgi:hypothetical protein